MGDIARQIKYKAAWRHTMLVEASRTFPSSKTCSACQYHNAKLKRERYWTCSNCGARHERNANAALNLLNLLTPPGRGEALRDGKALTGGTTAGETGPNDRRTAPPLQEEATLTV